MHHVQVQVAKCCYVLCNNPSDLFMPPVQNDTSLAPLSWGQYAAAVIAYYNQTGADSTCAPLRLFVLQC